MAMVQISMLHLADLPSKKYIPKIKVTTASCNIFTTASNKPFWIQAGFNPTTIYMEHSTQNYQLNYIPFLEYTLTLL
jgi:hypothetical protein